MLAVAGADAQSQSLGAAGSSGGGVLSGRGLFEIP